MLKVCISLTEPGERFSSQPTGPVSRLRKCRKSVQTPAEASEIRRKRHSSVPFLCLCWGILFSYFTVLALVCYSILVCLFFYHRVTFGSDPCNIPHSVPACSLGFLPSHLISAPKGESVAYFGLRVLVARNRPNRLVHSQLTSQRRKIWEDIEASRWLGLSTIVWRGRWDGKCPDYCCVWG